MRVSGVRADKVENQMPVFGSLRRSRSREEIKGNEAHANHAESEGSMFKHFLRRSSSLSTKEEKPAVNVNARRVSTKCTLIRQKTANSQDHSDAVEPSARPPPHRSFSASRKNSHKNKEAHALDENATTNDAAASGLHSSLSSKSAKGVMTRPTATAPAYTCEPSADGNGLNRDDVRHLFAGAPHFMLEKGSHGRSFPQVFFPWDKSLDVADLQGRRWLRHESFALSTLHAHLPVPDELDWQPTSMGPYKKADAWKRPAFELGIFESPNMLGMDGKEPGTVGLRHFLEMPVADRLRTPKQTMDAISSHPIDFSKMSTIEAMKVLQVQEGAPATGKHAARQDRLQLINGGPHAWKRVGIREISMQSITNRLARISSWHDEVVAAGWRVTVFDKQDCQTLQEELLTSFLFPPEHVSMVAGPQSIKQQLEVLYKVLTTPGAWIDFSLTDSRLRLGQILWEVLPQGAEKQSKDQPAPGMERWWLLVQILLSVELVLRLDAALRLGLAEHTGEYHISTEDIHHFNKLRNRKLDWDLVLARRFLDYFEVVPAPDRLSEVAPVHRSNMPRLLSRFSHRSAEATGVIGIDGIWDTRILPRRPKSQLDGLLRFARFVDWPDIDMFESRMRQELNEKSLATHSFLETTYGMPICGGSVCSTMSNPDTVELEPATENCPGGWLSRSWLTGLVLPGYTSCHLLISTLLENNPQALAEIGNTALLHGGFILNGRSWWSKACIVGRVIAPSEGVSECMGWISTPGLLLVNRLGVRLPSRWVNVEAAQTPALREKSRIHDGAQVSIESSPLGTGQGKVVADEFSMPGLGLAHCGSESQITVREVVLQETPPRAVSHAKRPIDEPLKASVHFTMKMIGEPSTSEASLRLIHDVYFVTAHPCRPPHGHAVHTSPRSDVHPSHEHGESLPSHPLHDSYKYVLKAARDLLSATPPNHADRKEAVWIVDATTSRGNGIFVRAWCSQVGRHAIVSRVGRTCLSCSIREAKAIEVGVIVRVGRNN